MRRAGPRAQSFSTELAAGIQRRALLQDWHVNRTAFSFQEFYRSRRLMKLLSRNLEKTGEGQSQIQGEAIVWDQ